MILKLENGIRKRILNKSKVVKGAILSKCKTYRYSLWRIWNDEKPLVYFIMLNPSTADQNVDDKTIRRLIGFAGAWGFGGFYVGNLFGYRATDPDELKGAVYWKKEIVGEENDAHLLNMAKSAETIVFAWGTKGTYMNRDKKVMAMFPKAYCIELSKDGIPKHPLYLDKRLNLIPFNKP